MLAQAHVYVIGDVIGVGFRAWTKIQAKYLHITGWVKNTFDKPDIFGAGGGVEALLQGEEENIEKLVTILQNGSPISRVDDVQVFWQKPSEVHDVFVIRK